MWKRGYILISELTGHKRFLNNYEELLKIRNNKNSAFWEEYRRLKNKNPNDEDKVNSAVKTAFARQFGKYPKIKDTILGWELQKKIELLKLAAKRLEDKKIGSLSVVKKDGKILVVGVPLEGGATTSTGVR